MGKAEIVGGGDKGLYQIKIKAYTDRAKETIKKIDAELEEMDSGPEVVFSPTLQQQATSIASLLDQYNQGIQENYRTERDNRELEKQLAYEKNQLSALEGELSDLESVRDERETAYSNAMEDGEYSPEQIQYLLDLLNSAQVDVDLKQAEVNSRQATITGLQAQLDAIEYIDVDPLLKDAQAQIKTFYEWSEKEPLSQLDDHVDLGQSILSAMGTAMGSAIEWFQDAATTNVEDQLKLLQLKEDQLPVSDSVSQHQIDTAVARSALDQKQSAYEEAYLNFLAGEISEGDLQPYIDERDAASAAYSAELVSLSYWESQYDIIELQKIECVAIDTEPMQERLNTTAEAHNDILYKQGALESFRDMQNLKKEALEKEKQRLNAAIAKAERQQDAWCADYTEDLAGEVATIEINGEGETVVIRPGFDDKAAYVESRDGVLMPPELGTPAQAFWNYAMMPGWQKWKPTFRAGKITTLQNNTCTVALEAAVSTAQKLNINQAGTLVDVPIDYMTCNGGAFKVGDRVIVMFPNWEWADPKVIGFVEEPGVCPSFLVVTISDGEISYALVWDVARNEKVNAFPTNPISTQDPAFQAWMANRQTENLSPLWAEESGCMPPVESDLPPVPSDANCWDPCYGCDDQAEGESSLPNPYALSEDLAVARKYRWSEAHMASRIYWDQSYEIYQNMTWFQKTLSAWLPILWTASNNPAVQANVCTYYVRESHKYNHDWDWAEECDPEVPHGADIYEQEDRTSARQFRFITPFGEIGSARYDGFRTLWFFGEGYTDEQPCYGYGDAWGLELDNNILPVWLRHAHGYSDSMIVQIFGLSYRLSGRHNTCAWDRAGRAFSEDGHCLCGIVEPESYCYSIETPPERHFVVQAAAVLRTDELLQDPKKLQINMEFSNAISETRDYVIMDMIAGGYDDSEKLHIADAITIQAFT